MIKYTINEITDWAPTFSLLEISLSLTLIQKGSLRPLRLIPLITEFSVYAPSGYSTREQLAGLQNYMQNK